MLRRRFIQGCLSVGVGGFMAVPTVYALTFESYKKQQAAAFDDYQARFRAAQQVFQQRVLQRWQQAKLTHQNRFVHYSKDLSVRSEIDYRAGTVTLEAQAPTPAAAGKKIKEELTQLLQMDSRKAYRDDVILQLVDQEQVNRNADSLVSEPLLGDLYEGQQVEEILQPAEKSMVEDRQPVAKVVIQLPEGATASKAKRYQPLAEKYAAEQRVSAALVMAVMHTESYFNPMARSHIPAFGLMQIVPESAGLDITEYLTGKQRMMTAAELYQPATNIQSGSAYLHLLYFRYLKQIEDPVSRLYCTIAAYNTGAGNLARSFGGSTKVSQAAASINNLQPEQVYQHLIHNLPYSETRDYLEKVTSKMALYRA
ncbi:transglycosylase SLT domain-containing protein [Oceanospirillum linum]|uniref:Transglycosylase SLT domain-containing protein n=1 Tax=Oceanospirillum linum TaxID=966 RepID=A0A1T1HCQ7_OCELI|nr:transglycosylase SLT domain-containing protein [Oceanospirillum linum]OOV87507.1 hypothetical protein BTA35_0205550 [Oceanospirillum linum]SEF90169.1 membrane-bound lytic murein transglycosylase C [Oleiphilus messinensis]SMP13448.1 membrane-bound lytic murein transglycosylase C [Oceanospirillum linum]